MKQPTIKHLIENNTSQLDHGKDVVQGLSSFPKFIPTKYLYDQRGSQLFEEICNLPEYYPTRTEAQIIKSCVQQLAQITKDTQIVELGSGSAIKTRLIIEAYQDNGYSLEYVPIDISSNALIESINNLNKDYPFLEISGLIGSYEIGLKNLPEKRKENRLVCFLGSTLGNFSPEQCDIFFSQLLQVLNEGDYFLLGIDLVKPIDILEAAYNDTQSVTANFNLNILDHLNWRFGGNFNSNNFHHQALFNLELSQIELHLISLVPQQVRLEKLNLDITLKARERILTEISRKFHLEKVQNYLKKYGFQSCNTWLDDNKWFALLLTQITK